MSNRPTLLVLVPSLRISGGNKEIVRLTQELVADGRTDAVIVCMWKHPHEVDTGDVRLVHLLEVEPVSGRALWQLPSIALRFRKLLAQLDVDSGRRVHLLLTHYSTYPLAWLAPTLPRICFNQDMEWLFVPEGWRRSLLKGTIVRTNRKSTRVTTNAYVTETFRDEGLRSFGEASIWAEAQWLSPTARVERDIDVLMLLRGSGIKRLDLYLEALRLLHNHTGVRVAVITPDTEIAARVRTDAHEVFLRPSDEEMRALFGRSRTFLLLSEVEGFGLPPLEGTGSGCIPVCRDSGGVRCYMRGPFAELLLPLDMPVQQIVDTVVTRLTWNDLPSAQAAQQAFAAGLEASYRSRADCVRRLQALIESTPQR